MLGSILGNILLVLGSSFIAGGFVQHLGEFDVIAAQTYVTYNPSGTFLLRIFYYVCLSSASVRMIYTVVLECF